MTKAPNRANDAGASEYEQTDLFGPPPFSAKAPAPATLEGKPGLAHAATRLSFGQIVSIGAMTFRGWMPRPDCAATLEEAVEAEGVEFLLSWARPGQSPWLAIGSFGWTQEVVA